MVQYDRYILNTLLDSYENSLLFTETNKVKVSVKFTFNKKNIPAYFDESSDEYDKIHAIVENLADKGFIKVFWKQGKILDKVTLELDKLEEVYLYIKRKPKKNQLITVSELLEQYRQSYDTPICKEFLKYLRERINNAQSVKEYVDIFDVNQMERIMKAVSAIENNKSSCYVREFSIRVFRDSKMFEGIKSKVIKVFRDFGDTLKQKTEEAILAEYYIYHTPNFVYLKGDMVLGIGGKRVPVDVLSQGVGISGEDIDKLELVESNSITSVMTIENLTSFFRCDKNGCLMIYLGGYHNSVRRKLLKKIYQHLPEADYYHFGDIDVGGLDIFRDLCDKTGIPFEKYKMDVATLQENEYCGKPLTNNDRDRIAKLIKVTKDEDTLKLLEYMLEKNVKLEQECII